MSKVTVPPAVKRLLYVFYGLAACLVLADWLIHRHVSHPAESVFAFYPLFGFVACVLLVFAAAAMRRIVMRPPAYYEGAEPADEKPEDVAFSESDDVDGQILEGEAQNRRVDPSPGEDGP